MSVKMKITTKIYLGFAVAVSICVFLGIYAVWNFNSIRIESSILTEEYVPEVEILSRLERNISKTMYNIRSYSFTGVEKFYDEGVDSLDRASERVKDAQDLVTKSPHLSQLLSTISEIQNSMKKYRQLVEETRALLREQVANRAQLDAAAGEAMKNATDYLASQEEAASKEISSGTAKDLLAERLSKIQQITVAINLINSARIAAWKAQARGDNEELQQVLENFPEIYRRVKDIRTTTKREINLRQLEAIDASARKYGNLVQTMARDLQRSAELGQKRNEAGQSVLDIIEKTTRAGFEGTVKIADNTSSIVRSSIMMFALGLAIAVLAAGIMAFFISSGIGRALRGIIEKLKDSSQQVTVSATQLSSAAQQLSGASNEQSSSIEETSSSLEEISGMIENNVSNADQSYKLSSEVLQVSEKANESMGKLEASIKEILQSNEKIEQLVKVIGNIGEKTKVMDEIVFQTKLLSFNASVEAERAGEHGRGFAVVAQEVGNLAQMSGKSAQEIAEIVKSSIHEAEAITTENKKKVNQGNQYVEESAKGLKMIMEAARTVSSGSNQVLQASKDQAAGIKQVSSAMTELDNATQQNAATAEETAASSEELSAQAEVLNAIVTDLYILVEGQKTHEVDAVRAPTPGHIAGKAPAKVVQLVKPRKNLRGAMPAQKKVVGSDVSHEVPEKSSDEAWEKL
jgi:CHASE3 domain sensor protein